MSSVIYGPVSSWRLGRSLGIDMLSTEGSTCSFNCIYCQLGNTVRPLVERREFVTLVELAKELERVKDVPADYATFSGIGEPTLASNLGGAIEMVKSTLKLPVAVLTNSSFIPREDVRRDLALADVVVAKVDAPDEARFQAINRPFCVYTLDEIIQGISRFRTEYSGKLALQMMFVEANRHCAPEMARIAWELSPDEVQINTPLRPCAVKPLPPEEIAAIRDEFGRLESVVTVYEAVKPAAIPLSIDETLKRRPEL
jgi:wyosine [tRNA(Phe)-imidazoG37] synthetase (radical SAM superfamily)